MKTVFFDIDTQNDFMLPAGALYVPGAERILPAIARLNEFCQARTDTSLVSTVDAHEENDPEFEFWPPHCIQGTLGQLKPAETVTGQIVFPKLTVNCFDSPHLGPLLAEIAADCYVVYGVVTEVCVRYAAMGLLKTGKPVTVISDAIRHLAPDARDSWMEEFTASGGRFATVEQVLTAVRHGTLTAGI